MWKKEGKEEEGDEKKKKKGRRRRKGRRKMKLGLHQSSSPDPNEDHFKIVSNHWSFLWGMEFGCDTKDGMKMKRSARAFGLPFDQIDFYLWASYYLICESDFLFANNFSLSAVSRVKGSDWGCELRGFGANAQIWGRSGVE